MPSTTARTCFVFRILHAGDGDLVRHRAAAGEELVPLVAHVLELAADERLVGFDRPEERGGAVGSPHLAEPVRQVPGGFLSDAEVAVELHARHALEVCRQQVHRDDPDLEPELARLHHGAGANAEPAPAVPAAERHRLVSAAGLDSRRPAPVAGDAVGPAPFDEEALGRGVVRPQLEHLGQCDAGSV